MGSFFKVIGLLIGGGSVNVNIVSGKGFMLLRGG